MAIAFPDSAKVPCYVFPARREEVVPCSLDHHSLEEKYRTRPYVQKFAEQQFRSHFGFIGKGNGPLSSPAGRLAEIHFWSSYGSESAKWLIAQLARSHDIAATWGISDILAEMGSAALDDILNELGLVPDVETADALLASLSKMQSQVLISNAVLSDLLSRYLSHRDDSVRMQAASATRLLPAAEAIGILQHALRIEADEDVRNVLGELIAQLALQ